MTAGVSALRDSARAPTTQNPNESRPRKADSQICGENDRPNSNSIPVVDDARLVCAKQPSSTEIAPASHIYYMQTFWQWLSQLRLCPLDETYFTFDPREYNELFDKELEKVIARTSDAKHRQALESMRGFNWMGYVAASVRNAGCRDQREVQERIHDMAVKLLMGKLFQGYDGAGTVRWT